MEEILQRKCIIDKQDEKRTSQQKEKSMTEKIK
jgi:hypothetical protein